MNKKDYKKILTSKSRDRVNKVDEKVLEWLYEEWSYIKDGKGRVVDTGTVVHSSRLEKWYYEFSHQQIIASLNRLKDQGYISDFNFIEGDSFDEYDFQHRIGINFKRDFEERFWERDTRLKKMIRDEKYEVKASASDALHLHIFSRESGKKVHGIYDKASGEVRFDKKDTSPGELLNRIESTLTTRDRRKIHVIFTFE